MLRRLSVLCILASGCADSAPEAALLRADLEVTSVRRSLTATHVRYAQLAPDGTRVLERELAIHQRAGVEFHRTTSVGGPVTLLGTRRTDLDPAALARATVAGEVLQVEQVALPMQGDRARAGWRVVVRAESHEWEVWVDGQTGAAQVRRDLARRVDGTGYVFRPNPVTSTGDFGLSDVANADTPVLTAARDLVVIQGLDGTGMLRGDYVDVENKTTRVINPSLVFDYTRSQDEFEEVNAYYHVDHAQRELQALGFTGAAAILAVPFHVVVNGLNADNSYYSPMMVEIQLGKGGVDDAEDGDVVLHEYGHAIQDDVVPGFGSTIEAGAIGEGFGDIVAATVPTGGPDLVERACVAPWDATSYAPGGCLRRVDGSKHWPEHGASQVHDDGEVWSGAMWDAFAQAGLSPLQGLQLVVEAQFLLAVDATFAESAAAVLMADAALHGGIHDAQLRRAFVWHGLLATISPPDPFVGVPTTEPLTLESAHPIADLADEQATISHAGAAAIRVHFASLDFEVSPQCDGGLCDAVYLYDAAGLLYARLGGTSGPVDAPAIPGDTVIVRWVSDGSVGSPGFVIDGYDWIAGGVIDAGPIDAAPGAPDAGAADATPGDIDAAPGTADAAPGTADAAPGTADAAPGTADAAPGTADAAPGTADASAGAPDAGATGGDESGCGCRTAPRRGTPVVPSFAALALLALAVLRRPRR